MRATNNLFRKVHNQTHWKWWFTQFERKSDVLEIFHYFQYFESFRSKKKWQISKPKVVHWYQVKRASSLPPKSFFQNYGQLSRASSPEPGWLGWLGAYRVDLYEKFQPGFWDEKKQEILGTSSGAKFEKQSKLALIIASTKSSARLLRSRLKKPRSQEPSQPALSNKRGIPIDRVPTSKSWVFCLGIKFLFFPFDRFLVPSCCKDYFLEKFSDSVWWLYKPVM